MPVLYLRSIDYLLIIWKRTKEKLIFINELNKKHETIKLEYKISSQKIPFLDAMVHKDKDNNLQTTLYPKPTDQQSRLHTKTEHPSTLQNNITYTSNVKSKNNTFYRG